MTKIYFGERFIALVEMSTSKFDSLIRHEVVTSCKDIPILLNSFIGNSDSGSLILECEFPEIVFKAISSFFRSIEAAGGVVFNDREEILLIYRLGKWDLPKGKVEQNESSEDAALREVEEECGITKVQMDELLCNTFHIYKYENEFILKVTHWYLMQYAGDEPLVPQHGEDISDARWIAIADLHHYTRNTYKNIVDVLQSTLKRRML